MIIPILRFTCTWTTRVHLFTSHEVPAYPGGQEHISTADALLSPLAEGFATCIANEWSLDTHAHKRKNMK